MKKLILTILLVSSLSCRSKNYYFRAYQYSFIEHGTKCEERLYELSSSFIGALEEPREVNLDECNKMIGFQYKDYVLFTNELKKIQFDYNQYLNNAVRFEEEK